MLDGESAKAGSGCAAGASEFENLHEIIRRARQNLSKNVWDTLIGGTETETTLKRNRLAIDSIAFRPRVLRDVSRVDTSVERFGRRLRMPVLLAPAGPLEIFGSGGGATVAGAAEAFGVAHMLSSGCTPLETVAAAWPGSARERVVMSTRPLPQCPRRSFSFLSLAVRRVTRIVDQQSPFDSWSNRAVVRASKTGSVHLMEWPASPVPALRERSIKAMNAPGTVGLDAMPCQGANRMPRDSWKEVKD